MTGCQDTKVLDPTSAPCEKCSYMAVVLALPTVVATPGLRPLRFVQRAEFRVSSFPQASCEGCRNRPACDDLLGVEPAEGELWLVRPEPAVNADGAPVPGLEHWACARNFGAAPPPDVRRLQMKVRNDWLETARALRIARDGRF